MLQQFFYFSSEYFFSCIFFWNQRPFMLCGTQTIETHTHTHTHTHTYKNAQTNLPNELISSSQKCILTYPLIYSNSDTQISFFYSFVITLSLSLFFYLEFFFTNFFFLIESVQDLTNSFTHMLNIKMWITRQNYLCNSNKCAKSIQWSSLIIKHATPLNEPIYTHFRQYDLLKTSEDR